MPTDSTHQQTTEWLPTTAPGFVGAAVGLLVGVLLIGYGMWSFFEPTPPPLPKSIAIVVIGFVEWISCFYTMRKARAAWAFGLSLNATGVVIFLFGTPNVRDAFEVGMALAFVPVLIFAAITMLLIFSAEEFG